LERYNDSNGLFFIITLFGIKSGDFGDFGCVLIVIRLYILIILLLILLLSLNIIIIVILWLFRFVEFIAHGILLFGWGR